MRIALPLIAALPALVAARNAVAYTVTGGWLPADVTDANTDLLHAALSGSSYSSEVGDKRVCCSNVRSVEEQVVAGMKYRFHINGCSVTQSAGKCDELTLTTCTPSKFVVEVYEQVWTRTLQVKSIESVSEDDVSQGGDDETTTYSSTTDDEVVEKVEMIKVADEEKEAVDAWITAEGLNEFGDKATTVYMGGTPLFNEKTGSTKDLYDYILSRHPDRPWQTRAATATSFAVTKSGENATLVQGFVATALSVLTVVLVGVAIVKVRHGRRDRFPYTPIDSR